MRSSKSRSRSKSNRNRSVGNIVNRVFDSSGPEGKVRGTPQQIIDKYNQLARDAQLSNDRVAMENFQQHGEHYTRMLSEAQREADARREQQEAQNRERQRERDEARTNQQQPQSQQHRAEPEEAPQVAVIDGDTPQPEIAQTAPEVVETPSQAPAEPEIVDLGTAPQADSGLVETPENGSEKAATEAKPRARKPRAPRKKVERKPQQTDASADTSAAEVAPAVDPAPESEKPAAE